MEKLEVMRGEKKENFKTEIARDFLETSKIEKF